MKIKCKLFAGAVLLLLATAVPALAAPTVDIDKNYSTGEIYVNITEEESKRYTAMLLMENLATEELLETVPAAETETENGITRYNTGELMGYVGEFDSNQQLTIEMKTSGSYTLHIASKATGEKSSYPITITSKNDYITAIDELNSTITNNDKDEFYQKVLENKDKLGFDIPLLENQNLKDISDLIFNEINGTLISPDAYYENILLYKACIALDTLNKGIISGEASSIIDELMENDPTIKAYYDKHITNDERNADLKGRLVNKAIASTADLKNKIIDALVLTVVRYPDGYMNIRDIFDTYKAEIGITAVTDDAQVYSSLVGNYASVSAMLDKYEELCDEAEDTASGGSGGSGGGSGGGGSSGSAGGSGTSTIGFGGYTPAKSETVGMKFDDMDTAEWAYEAVSALADAGIIAGKSETKFAPRDKVKREEFVRMVIAVIKENTDEYSGIFTDVQEGAWYAEYVEKAYRMNIAGGIGDSMFGSGRNITRQDMAVMLYNALLAKGESIPKAEIGFSDSHLIADYAKEAVAVLVNAKIINGQGDNTFNPHGEATRAEAAAMIYGVYKILN